MSDIQFRQVKDMAGNVRTDAVQYTDESGVVWFVPEDHRFWTEIYEPWLAAGNTPSPA
ncbi:hypothetical protein [Burkholderia cenocepacia]|uniref:hypothetical protein n=1 Tax=Burkholderia cenocepacia TaxID=95486 RepID=UPI001588C222|nr:hypothetical protein [Burkholderia cenocepacia]